MKLNLISKRAKTAQAVLCVLCAIFAAACGKVDDSGPAPTGTDEIFSIGKLYVEYYADLDSASAGKPLEVVVPESDPVETATRIEAPKLKDISGKDEVTFMPDNPEYVYDADGNPVAISDVASDYDWSKNPNGYTGFKVTAKFEMPEFTIMLEYQGEPVESSVPAPKVKSSTFDGQTRDTSYPFVAWKTLTGSVAPDTDAVLDVVEDARLARAMVKISADDVTPPEYLLKVYAIYQDSFSIDQQLKIAAQRQREAEAKIKLANSKLFDDEKLVGQLTRDADESNENFELVERLRDAYDKLNVASKGKEKQYTADLGNGETEEVTVIEYDNDAIAFYSELISDLIEELAERGDVTTQIIPTTLTLAVDYEYGAIYGIDPDDPSKLIITNPGEVTVKRVYSVTAASTGTYEIELWGGSGGHVWAAAGTTYTGGKGSHYKVRVHLNAGNVLRFYLGGEAEGTAGYDQYSDPPKFFSNGVSRTVPKAGGWNGGGTSGNGLGSNVAGGGGGGATDVRLVTKNGKKPWSDGTNNSAPVLIPDRSGVGNAEYTVYTYLSNAPKLDDGNFDPMIKIEQDVEGEDYDIRIAVAGGGGGAAQDCYAHQPIHPGNGGDPEDGYLQWKTAATPRFTLHQALFNEGLTDGAPIIPEYGKGYISPLVVWVGGTGRSGNAAINEGCAGGGGGFYGGRTMIVYYPNNVSYNSQTYANQRYNVSSGGGGSNFPVAGDPHLTGGTVYSGGGKSEYNGVETVVGYTNPSNSWNNSEETLTIKNGAGTDITVKPYLEPDTESGETVFDMLNQVYGDGRATIKFVEAQ